MCVLLYSVAISASPSGKAGIRPQMSSEEMGGLVVLVL